MWFLVNHTKPINTFELKSASGKLQNSGQLQNNTVNGVMSITVNRVIIKVILMAAV